MRQKHGFSKVMPNLYVGKKLLCGLFTVALSALLSSCEPEENLTIEMDRDAFDREHVAWSNLDLKDYQFTYHYFSASIGPFGPFTITVRENEEPVVENEGRHSDDLVFRSIYEVYDYIGGSFKFIENVKNGTHEGHKVRSVALNITYNTQYHYPVETNLSTEYAAENIVGGMGHYNILITDFTPLN